MRKLLLIALLSLTMFRADALGQGKNSTDEGWPPLPPGRNKMIIVPEAQPWFNIDPEKLEKTTLTSNPSSVERCGSTLEECILYVSDFYSERKGIYGKKKDVLRPGVMMHHYPYVLSGGHGHGTGTDVFYLPNEKVFYLWGDCGMNHADMVWGPFRGDPKVVLAKLIEPPDSK